MTDPKRTALRLIALYRAALRRIADYDVPDPAEYAESVLAAGEQELDQ